VRRRVRALLLCAAHAATAAGAAPLVLARTRAPGGESVTLALGGVLVAALAPGDGGELLVLVRPADEPDGARRLVRLLLAPEPRAEPVLEGLGGWVKTLAALDLGRGAELVAGGLGRAVSLGPLAAPGGPGRALVEHPGFDLRSLAPAALRTGVERRFAAAEAGHLRSWEPDGDALRLASDLPLPVAAERTAAGLVLSSPRATPVVGDGSRRWLLGPAPAGGARLRTLLAPADGGAPVEAWSALPAGEEMAASWPVVVDGEPALVVRAQGAGRLDLLESQRLRVLPLASDRTRAGAPPTFAVELDAKRWQETRVLVADADGDGRDDLLAAYPEGLTGGDLVVETWRGLGAGRFEARARRTDLADTPAAWDLLPAATEEGRPALLLVGKTRLELRALAAAGRGALEAEPRRAVARPPEPVARPDAPGAAGRARRTGGEPRELPAVLGVAELDGRPGPEALFLLAAGAGGERLVVLRAGAPPPGR